MLEYGLVGAVIATIAFIIALLIKPRGLSN